MENLKVVLNALEFLLQQKDITGQERIILRSMYGRKLDELAELIDKAFDSK